MGGIVVLLQVRRTHDLQVAGSSSASALLRSGLLGKLLTPVCLCHQAVWLGTGQSAVAVQLGSTDTMVRVWVTVKTLWSSCYTRAVCDFSLLSCMTACCSWVVWFDYNIGSLLLLLLLCRDTNASASWHVHQHCYWRAITLHDSACWVCIS